EPDGDALQEPERLDRTVPLYAGIEHAIARAVAPGVQARLEKLAERLVVFDLDGEDNRVAEHDDATLARLLRPDGLVIADALGIDGDRRRELGRREPRGDVGRQHVADIRVRSEEPLERR